MQAARKPTWAILDPLLGAEALKRPSHALIEQCIQSLPTRPTAIIGVVCVDQHWIPFLWTWTVHCVIASCWDIPGPSAPGLAVLHQSIATAVGSRTWTVHAVHRTFAITEYCGLCAVRFIDHMLRGKMLPTNLDEVKQLHAAARSMYVQFWIHVPPFVGLGFGLLDLIPKRLIVFSPCYLNMVLTRCN